MHCAGVIKAVDVLLFVGFVDVLKQYGTKARAQRLVDGILHDGTVKRGTNPV